MSRSRGLALSCALALFGSGSAAWAQGPEISHKPVGCIVAGKYPKLDACFEPGDFATARIYFKSVAGAAWYWVEFPATACGTAILPKPSKKLTQMSYYVEVVDRKGESSRSADILTDVVANEGECKKDIPVAPWLSTASVAVGAPAGAAAIPAGFAVVSAGAGVGAAAVVGGAAVVAGGGAAAVVAASNDSTPTATATSSPTATATSTPTATATATPTATATNKPTATATPTCGSPAVMVTTPSGDKWSSFGGKLFVAADATDGQGIANVEFFLEPVSTPGPPVSLGSVTSVPYELDADPPCTNGTPTDFLLYAVATNVCGQQTTSVKYMGVVNRDCGPGLRGPRATNADRTVSWSTRLEVPDARSTLVVNGAASALRTGALAGRTAVKAPNMVEVTLTDAPAQPGLWRFELQGATWDPQRVVVREGSVVSLTPQAIVFRLRGKAGERASFSFELRKP